LKIFFYSDTANDFNCTIANEPRRFLADHPLLICVSLSFHFAVLCTQLSVFTSFI